jgi:hypothetical protein
MGSGQKRQKSHNTQQTTSQLLGSCYGPIQLGAGWGRPAIIMIITVNVIVALFKALHRGCSALPVAECSCQSLSNGHGVMRGEDPPNPPPLSLWLSVTIQVTDDHFKFKQLAS